MTDKNRTMIPQYSVTADPDTGKWLTVPQFERLVNQARWVARVDTPTAHFDTYEVEIKMKDKDYIDLVAFNELLTETRAIEVRWEIREVIQHQAH